MDSKQSRLKARLEQRIEERRVSRAAGPDSPPGQALGPELPELAELPGPDQQQQQQQPQQQEEGQMQQQLQSTGDPPELVLLDTARPTAHEESPDLPEQEDGSSIRDA